MDAKTDGGTIVISGGKTNVVRTSGREIVVKRSFNASPRIVFEAWSKAELFSRWWVPKSMPIPLRACELDVRTGGTYRLEFGHDADNTFAFHGKYLEVVPQQRMVWTNDEGEEGAITTVTFEEKDGQTLVTYHEIYPTDAALDEALAEGGPGGLPEQFDQLAAFLNAA